MLEQHPKKPLTNTTFSRLRHYIIIIMCLPNTSNTVITLDKEKNQVGSTFMSYLFLFSSHIHLNLIYSTTYFLTSMAKNMTEMTKLILQ